jgi:hypothetical protein
MDFSEDHNLVHSEEYEREGVHYIVFVTKFDDHFWGGWFCEQCEYTHQPNNPSSSVKNATIAAITTIGGHHFGNHKNK